MQDDDKLPPMAHYGPMYNLLNKYSDDKEADLEAKEQREVERLRMMNETLKRTIEDHEQEIRRLKTHGINSNNEVQKIASELAEVRRRSQLMDEEAQNLRKENALLRKQLQNAMSAQVAMQQSIKTKDVHQPRNASSSFGNSPVRPLDLEK